MAMLWLSSPWRQSQVTWSSISLLCWQPLTWLLLPLHHLEYSLKKKMGPSLFHYETLQYSLFISLWSLPGNYISFITIHVLFFKYYKSDSLVHTDNSVSLPDTHLLHGRCVDSHWIMELSKRPFSDFFSAFSCENKSIQSTSVTSLVCSGWPSLHRAWTLGAGVWFTVFTCSIYSHPVIPVPQ